jgi:prepilin peptidase CpaA
MGVMNVLPLDLITLELIAGMGVAAAWHDARNLQIPNRFPAAIVALYPIHVMAMTGPADIAGAVGVAAAILFVGFCLFGIGLIGAGDVKLLTAAGLLAGPDLSAGLILITAVSGGVIACGLLTPWGEFLLNHVQKPAAASISIRGISGKPSRQRMPYGLAIASGLLVVTGCRAGLL